jgi:hypothetical protein
VTESSSPDPGGEAFPLHPALRFSKSASPAGVRHGSSNLFTKLTKKVFLNRAGSIGRGIAPRYFVSLEGLVSFVLNPTDPPAHCHGHCPQQ